VCSLRVWVGVLRSCKLWLSWDGFGGLLSFFFLGCFFYFKLCVSLVYCWCTKGCLTLLIKSVYYLSKKKEPWKRLFLCSIILCIVGLRLMSILCLFLFLTFSLAFLFLVRCFPCILPVYQEASYALLINLISYL